jgi:hypothetical protein
MSSESCTSLVSNVALKLLEIVVLRFYARCVRGRFCGFSDPSVSMTLFLDIIAFVVVFLAYICCALVLAAIRLRSAPLIVFCVCLASRAAFRFTFF